MPLNIDWQQILLHLFNFLILGIGLYLLLYKPVKKFMKKREDTYAEREEKTAAAVSDAEKTREEYEKKLAAADEEIAGLRKQAALDAENAGKAIVGEARADAEKIVADARAAAVKEHDRIVGKAGDDIRDIVGKIAEKVGTSNDVDAAYEEFLAADLDGLAGILAEENAVADLDIHRDELAGIVALARTDGNHFALIGLFAGRIRKNDAAGGGALDFETLDNHAVMQRTNLHFSNSKQF